MTSQVFKQLEIAELNGHWSDDIITVFSSVQLLSFIISTIVHWNLLTLTALPQHRSARQHQLGMGNNQTAVTVGLVELTLKVEVSLKVDKEGVTKMRIIESQNC